MGTKDEPIQLVIDLTHLRELAETGGACYWLLWTELDRRIRLGHDDDPSRDDEMEALRMRMDIAARNEKPRLTEQRTV